MSVVANNPTVMVNVR